MTTATMDFLVPPDAARALIRDQVLAGAVDDPAVRARVDSGRLAEPFWYADSPLTTPDPTRPAPGRPPRGHAPAPAPGVLLPDAPVPGSRIRALARDGLMLLIMPGVDVDEAVAREPSPVRVLRLAEGDPLAVALGARPGEVWVVRPDAHIAAVVTDPAELPSVLDRTIGRAGTTALIPRTTEFA